MLRRIVRSFLLALAAVAVAAPGASAAPVSYTATLGFHVSSSFVIDGDQLTALNLTIFPTSCSSGSVIDAVRVALPAPVRIIAGAVHAEADAALPYPDSGLHVTFDGTLSADRATVTGTVSESGLHTPFDASCPSVSHRFFAALSPATVPPDPEHQFSFAGPNSKGDLTAGHITRLIATVPTACGNSQVYVPFDSRAYGIADIPVSASGAWSLTHYVLDDYSVVRRLTITGQVSGGNVTARYQVASTDVGGTFLADCVGDATLSATATGAKGPTGAGPQPTVPGSLGSTPTTSIGPSATFQWMALRRQTAGGFRFYFLVAQVHCQRGATHVQIAFDGGRVHTVRCGASLAWASGPQAPGRGYFARSTAVTLRRHRVVKRGRPVVTDLRMPQANATWTPIGRVPGRPPRI